VVDLIYWVSKLFKYHKHYEWGKPINIHKPSALKMEVGMRFITPFHKITSEKCHEGEVFKNAH